MGAAVRPELAAGLVKGHDPHRERLVQVQAGHGELAPASPGPRSASTTADSSAVVRSGSTTRHSVLAHPCAQRPGRLELRRRGAVPAGDVCRYRVRHGPPGTIVFIAMKRPLYTEAKRAPDLDERPTFSVVVWIERWLRLIVDADPALVALLDTPQPRSGTAASTLAYLAQCGRPPWNKLLCSHTNFSTTTNQRGRASY